MSIFLMTATVLCISHEVITKDLKLGAQTPESHKIFEDVRYGTASQWLKTDYVVVEAPKNEVIAYIVATDLSENKDGDVFIENGGIDKKGVTIAVKSSTFLKGFRYKVEVYAASALPIPKKPKKLDKGDDLNGLIIRNMH